MMNRAFFFDSIRHSIFGGRFSQKQTDGLDTLIDAWEAGYSEHDQRHFAYCLATAYHETAATMQPIAEYGSDSRAERLYGPTGKNPSRAKRMGNSKPGDGARYKGRGYVQLTWKKNYRKAAKAVGDDLEGKPDLAMRPDYAARILYQGCLEGWFTTKKLSDYITDEATDYKRARYVVNGQDKATKIAGYAEKFEAALKSASTQRFGKASIVLDGTEDFVAVPEVVAPPDMPTPQKPKSAPVKRSGGFLAWLISLFK